VLGLLLQKLAHIILVLLLVSLITMLMVDLSPGDSAYSILGENATPEQVAQVNKKLGLNDPLQVRWARWVNDTVHGDLGRSVRTGQSVTDALRERLPVTAELAFLALFFSLLIAIPVGVYTAYRSDRWLDRTTGVATSLLISSPAFLTGVLLSYLFAVKFHIFPVTGWVKLTENLGENLKSAFLPALTLALTEIAVFTRLVRADMIATLQDNFILTARAKGLSDRYILMRHAFRPSSFSLLTLSALSLGRLIGGAVIVENVFAIPGIGSLLVSSIIAGDLVMVQGTVLFVAIVYVVVNALVDVAYGFLEPRVRVGRA